MKNVLACLKLFVVGTIIVFGMISITGTGGGSGSSDNQDVQDDGSENIKNIEYAADPVDPLILSVEYEDGNEYGLENVNIYGWTDEEGSEYLFTHVYVNGEEDPFRFDFDSNGRIESIHSPDGSAINYSYTADTLFANYITNDGQIGINMIPIEGELKELLNSLENQVNSEFIANDKMTISNNKYEDKNIDTTGVTVSADPLISIADTGIYPKTHLMPFIMRVSVAHFAPSGSLKGVVSINDAKVSCPDQSLTCEYLGTTHGPFDILSSKQTDYIWVRGTIDIVINYEDIQHELLDCDETRKNAANSLDWIGAGATVAGMVCGPFSTPVGIGAGLVSLGAFARNKTTTYECEYFVERQFAAEKAEEIGITIEPYSKLYDLDFNEPIMANADTECLEIGECKGNNNDTSEYVFSYSLRDEYAQNPISCDTCPLRPNGMKVHEELNSNDIMTISSNNYYWSDMDYLPPGNENVCKIELPDEYVVWYMDNVQCWDAPRVYATHRDAFNLEEDTCNIPGGGINCDIKVEKVEIQGGFSTLEAAQDWFCPQITTEWYHYWCNHRGPRVETSGGGLYTLQIPCDLTDVPYKYP